MEDLQSKRVLIVDDEIDIAWTLQMFLQKIGYRPRIAGGPNEALSLLGETPFDLVISDLAMPGCDGLTFMREARRRHPRLEFIMMTAFPGDPCYADIIHAGASDCLVKPFALKELSDRIDRLEREGRFGAELLLRNRELEASIKKSDALAQEAFAASREKSRHLAWMSHEIRNPLNGIIGYTDLLLCDTELSEEQNSYARNIRMCSDVLLTQINNVLDYSKIEAGEMAFEAIDFDPELLCFEVCDLVRPKVWDRPVEILCRVGEELPSMVSGDPNRFRQVLLNLMGNAAKFTRKGEVELFIDVGEKREAGYLLHTRVRDTGTGIAAGKIPSIFKPFGQESATIARQFGGTGLGLSICSSLAAMMGGKVWAESDGAGAGATFHFTAKVGPPEKMHEARGRPEGLSGKKVLIVDDNASSLEIVSLKLACAGMAVTCRKEGGCVLSLLSDAARRKEPFHLCILDTDMPGASGYQVAEAVRKGPPAVRCVPLLALSSPMPGRAKICENAGFDGFLSKPVQRGRLFRLMMQLMEAGGESRGKDEGAARTILTHYAALENIKHSITILLAEDEPVNRRYVEIIMKKGGYRVEMAENGRVALEKYRSAPDAYDILLMDIQMPEMDGYEAACAIRSWEKEAPGKGASVLPGGIPIVAVTGGALAEDRQRCLSAGMNDCLVKPIKREQVFQMIKRWVLA